MKGYKATYNMGCRGFEYEVGKTYEAEGELKMCENGFHFCQNQQDVLAYYSYNKDFVLLEVEALGEVLTDGDKSVTNKIRILRIVPKEEWEFLEGGNVIRYKYSRISKEILMQYDERTRLIYYKDTHGYEFWKKYDEHNRLIYFKESSGWEVWYSYDERGNRITHRDEQNLKHTTY